MFDFMWKSPSFFCKSLYAKLFHIFSTAVTLQEACHKIVPAVWCLGTLSPRARRRKAGQPVGLGRCYFSLNLVMSPVFTLSVTGGTRKWTEEGRETQLLFEMPMLQVQALYYSFHSDCKLSILFGLCLRLAFSVEVFAYEGSMCLT